MVVFIRKHANNDWLKEAEYTPEEEEKLFDVTLQDVMDNTRWYLDNLEYLREYRVYWQCYSRKGVTLPRKLIKRQ